MYICTGLKLLYNVREIKSRPINIMSCFWCTEFNSGCSYMYSDDGYRTTCWSVGRWGEGMGGGTWNWEPSARLFTNGYIQLRRAWKKGYCRTVFTLWIWIFTLQISVSPLKTLPEGWNTLGCKGPVKLNNVKSLLPKPKSDCPGQSGNLTVAAWLCAQGKSKNNYALFSSITRCTGLHTKLHAQTASLRLIILFKIQNPDVQRCLGCGE